MIYIKLDSNMDLAITVNDTIYRGDKLNSKIIYLIPPMINDIAISSSRIYLNYIRADGVADVVELERKVAMYNDEYYQYTIPSSCYLSKCVGEVCTWIQIYSGSPSSPAISKSSKCILMVEKPKGIESNLCDHQLTSVYTLLKKYETLTEMLEKLDATLKYDPDTNVLSVNCANEVLSEVTLPVTSDAVFKLIGDISSLPNFGEDDGDSDESQELNKNLVDWLNTFYNELDDTVFDIYDYLDYLDSDIPWNDISKNTNARHTHDNKETLDKITGIYEGGGEGDSADIVTLGALLEATTSIVQTLSEKIPTTLPNPNSITINVGETSTSYDGSEAVTIDIPTGSGTEQGVSPTATVTKEGSVATITITDVNGTTTATVKDGTDGHSPEVTATKTNGATAISVDGTVVAEVDDGVTPVKGTDYWTETDKKEIVEDVLTDSETAESAEKLEVSLNSLLTLKTVTQDDIHWHTGWEAPNKVSDTDDLAGCTLNLATNLEGRTSTTPFWIPSGTVLTRNDDYYKAVDAADSSDTQPVNIMVSRYDPDNKSANPNGWVKVKMGAMQDISDISILVSGWYVLSTVYGYSGKDNRLYGQPYTFRYTLEQDMEPNYIFTLDWGTYYTIRDNSYSQPAFSNGLNWVCRREPGCPYYLHNSGSGSDLDRGRYKTTDLTLDTKTGSSVSGILSYRDEIWSFYGSVDDHSGLGSVSKIKVYDNHWIEYLGVCWVNAGHINSVSYDAATDTVVWGNGSTSYTLEGEGYLLNNFSTSALATSYHDEICLLDDMGVETVSLPVADYGVKANLIPVGTDYYDNGVMSLIVALLTNDGNTLRFGHIQGTAAAKPQYYWTNCTWGDAVTIGDASETIGSGSTESYQHCVQDMTVWDGKLTWGEGHGENRIAQLRQTPTESTRESLLFQSQPNSGIAALTAHGHRLFGSGVNLFCLLGDSQIPYTYGKTPGETVAELPIVAEVNYWNLGTRHEATRLEVQGVDSTTETLISPTDTRTIAYDYYVRGGTSNGYWVLSGGEKQPTLEINGNDFTITQTATGYGLALPMRLTVGKTYKISYTASGGHRLYHSYYDATGVYQKLVQIVNNDSTSGTFEWTFTVENYTYCVLLIRADSGTVTFTDVRITDAT